MEVQANGKIVVAGDACFISSYSTCDLALARYKPNGALDTTFSGDGKQFTDFGGVYNGASGLVIQSNGKIVVAGVMGSGANYDFAVYRYLSDGSLDTTFSGDGMVNFGFGAGRRDIVCDVAVQSDGKIVVAGNTADSSSSANNFAIARLNANGTLDTTFSGDGKQTTNFGADDYGYGHCIALQADGKIVVVGEKNVAGLLYVALARYNPDGSLDTTFNGSGKKVFSFFAGKSALAYDVGIQPDGKIVIAGSTYSPSGPLDFALARLLNTGAFDTTFSGDGKLNIDFGGSDGGNALALQPLDGKYVLAGSTHDGSQGDFALARVLP